MPIFVLLINETKQNNIMATQTNLTTFQNECLQLLIADFKAARETFLELHIFADVDTVEKAEYKMDVIGDSIMSLLFNSAKTEQEKRELRKKGYDYHQKIQFILSL